MKKYCVSTLLWVKFCMNYPDIREVISWICKKTKKEWLIDHFYEKFCYCYDTATSRGAMNMFYCELDQELRDALVEYALTVYAPNGMMTTFEANKELLGL